MTTHYLNMADVGSLIGVSKQRVLQMRDAKQMPVPDATYGALLSPLWLPETIYAWEPTRNTKRGRPKGS